VRVIVAILLLAGSTIALALGIGQRALADNQETIDVVISTNTKAPATIIHGRDLGAYPGRQTITVTGGVSGPVPAESGEGFEIRRSSEIFVAYGRTVDVMGWLSPARHTQLRFDAATQQFQALPRVGAELWLPSPVGSDLWVSEFQDTGSLTFQASIPEDVTVLIMSDGLLPAPTEITISWPLVVTTPWTIVLIVVGVVALVAGAVVLLIHYLLWRQRRGPRRRLTKRPKYRTKTVRQPRRSSVKPRGRRGLRFVALPVAGALLWGATGCQNTLSPSDTSAETQVALDIEAQAPYPAVTELQFSRIMSRVAQQVQAADEELSVNVLGARVTEPTLQTRRASYIVRRADNESGVLLPILSSPIRLVLPQQTQGWPRSVFGIIQDEQDLESPSFGVILRQEDPRSPYLLSYAIVLAPQVQLPDVPSARIGAAKLSADSKLTRLSPAEVLAHYSDVINRGVESEFVGEFALATDSLFAAIGPDAQALRQESFGESVEVSWETTVGEVDIVAFATTDGGALVAGVLRETETVKPRQSGAAVNASISVRALTALSQSLRGFDVHSSIQILLYVPPVGSEESIRVLGYTYSLVGAKEVDSG
jgi:hypothetical protein